MPWFRASTFGWFLFAGMIVTVIGFIVALFTKTTWFTLGGDIGDAMRAVWLGVSIVGIPIAMILSCQFSYGYDYQEIQNRRRNVGDGDYLPADDYHFYPWWKTEFNYIEKNSYNFDQRKDEIRKAKAEREAAKKSINALVNQNVRETIM